MSLSFKHFVIAGDTIGMQQLSPRQLRKYGKYIKFFDSDHRDALLDHVSSNLKNNRIVNIVLGKMEYGPRALCNTTTLALTAQGKCRVYK